MRQRDDLRARSQHILQRAEIDPPILGQRADVDDGTGPLRDHLPGDDIGMMFQHGEDDPVALAQVCRAPALGDEVDPLGRPAHEDHFVLAIRADEIRHAPPRRFVTQRHLRTAAIDAAMHGRVIRT